MGGSFFEAATLVTVARDPTGTKADFVTRRHVNGAGQLIQTNEHDGSSMERTFERK